MKTNLTPCGSPGTPSPKRGGWPCAGIRIARRFRAASGAGALALALGWAAAAAQAQVPEPDNVVYGRIALGTNLVTAQRTNIVIEVQNPGGQVISSYRMGQDPNLGDFYAVAINVWFPDAAALAPTPSPAGQARTLRVNEQVLVAGQVATFTRYQTNFVLGERGHAERIDFGDVGAGPAGYEAWAVLHGLAAGSQNLDADGDGFANGREFVAGTNPTDPNSRFAIAIGQGGGNVSISFVALRAAGTGYEGVGRFYSLLSAEDPTGPWTPLSGCQDIPGDDQTHVCLRAATNSAPQFYRGQVDLR